MRGAALGKKEGRRFRAEKKWPTKFVGQPIGALKRVQRTGFGGRSACRASRHARRAQGQRANGRESWHEEGRGTWGGGLGPTPCSAKSLAIEGWVSATSTQRIGPPQRGHVSRSARKTWARSHAQRLRGEGRSSFGSTSPPRVGRLS